MVNGGLSIRRLFVVFVNVGFTLADDVWPVVGMREGEIGEGWFSMFFACATVGELVGVDVEEFEVEVLKGVGGLSGAGMGLVGGAQEA